MGHHILVIKKRVTVQNNIFSNLAIIVLEKFWAGELYIYIYDIKIVQHQKGKEITEIKIRLLRYKAPFQFLSLYLVHYNFYFRLIILISSFQIPGETA